MIGYDQPMLKAKAPMVVHDFDFIRETERNTVFAQVKCPSLSDYDDDGVDGEDADVRPCLDRWGDLRVPERLLSR